MYVMCAGCHDRRLAQAQSVAADASPDGVGGTTGRAAAGVLNILRACDYCCPWFALPCPKGKRSFGRGRDNCQDSANYACALFCLRSHALMS